MFEDINKYVDILIDLDITPTQFLILWLIENKDEANIKKYKDKFGDFNVDAIIDLIDRGLIEDFGVVKDNKRTFNIYDFLVTEAYRSRTTVDKYDAVEELIEAFPNFMVINGVKIAAKSYDIEGLSKIYLPCHKNSRLKHQKIIDITKRYFATKNNIADRKIENYITGRYWKIYEELLDNGQASKDLIQNY